MSIGEKLRFFGKNRFGQMSKFAEALDMTDSSLQKYLNDDREPGSGILRKLRKLGCDLNWLLSEESLVKEDTVEYSANKLHQENEELKKIINQIKQLLEKDGKKDGPET